MQQDPTRVVRDLERMDRLRRAPLQLAIEALDLRAGSRILDIGCGIGLQAMQIASAIPASSVIGLDISRPLLQCGHSKVARSATHDRIHLVQGDMRQLPFADNSFDACWSVDCLGYPAGDHVPLLREAVRVSCPGATIALLAWSSQALLPGHTLLESRLNATASTYTPFLSRAAPEQHFMRLARYLPAAGVRAVRCSTFVGQVVAPLDEQQRTALLALFEMLWGSALDGASADDQAAYARLCRPGSADCILELEDYVGFFTYTMFRGVVG